MSKEKYVNFKLPERYWKELSKLAIDKDTNLRNLLKKICMEYVDQTMKKEQ